MKRKFLSSETFDLQVPDWIYHSYVSAIVKIKVGAFPPYDQDYIDWIDQNPINLDMLFYKDGDENKFTGRFLFPSGKMVEFHNERKVTDQELGKIESFLGNMVVIKSTTIFSRDGTGQSIWKQLLAHPDISVEIKKVTEIED